MDADQIGRDLTADGSELLPVLDQVFGPAGELGEPGKPILREDGSLDRKALGAIAFSAQEKKEKLDPRSMEIIEYAIQSCKKFQFKSDKYAPEVYEDFQVVDLKLIESAIPSAIF